MPIRTYRLTTQNTGSVVGLATTTMVANGRIVGVTLFAYAVGGAGTGSIITEVALNNSAVSNAFSVSGAPSEQLISRIGIAFGNAGTGQSALFVPLNINVRQGNIICMNQGQTGTVPSFYTMGADVQVQEGA